MAKLTAAQRARLKPSQFACPGTRSYPIHRASNIISAKSYYKRRYTAKCRGGKSRICTAARRKGLMKPSYSGSAKWRRWCNR